MLLSIFLGVAAAAYGIRLMSVRHSALRLRQLAEEAGRHYNFVAAHAQWVAYLELHPTDIEAHLQAARSARRAEFLEDFTGPDAALAEQASYHLHRVRHARKELGNETLAAAATLEETLGRVQKGEFSDSGTALFWRIQEGGPDAPLVLEALIQSYLRHLQFEKAQVCVESLLKFEPESALALLWRGRIREQLRLLRGAGEDLSLAVRLVPEFDAARYYLAEWLLRTNQLQEADTHLQVLNARAPDNLLVRLAWASCRISLGDDVVGGELLDAWLADAPQNHPRLLEALTARADLALSWGRALEAEAFARRALEESPLDHHALHTLARSLDLQGRTPEARVIEEQLNKIKGDLRLVAQCRDGLDRNPSDLHLRHEIGAAYLRLGRPGDAFVWLNGILDRDPMHRPTLQTLADYHARSGHENLAAEMRRRLAEVP